MTEEILDFEEAVDFNLSDNPDALNNELLDESMFDLDGTMDFGIDEQLDKDVDTDAQDKAKENEGNNELNNVETTPPPEEDPEELKLGLDEVFDMDDPDFLKDFSDVNGGLDNDGNLEDDEFWKEFGLDKQDSLDKEIENDSRTGKLTPEKLETDNATVTSKSSQKENTLSAKKLASSESDAAKGVKGDSKKSNSPSTGKSAPMQRSTQQRSSHQRQLQPPSNHHSQQNNQNFRGRGMRRNDWRPGNEFFNGNMSSFRSGFGPGIEGMPGMPIPMGNPMIPNMNIPGPMIGPNIHVNPNFARLRPHALPFANQMGQFPPMGSGGPPMNMMPFQGQMDISPFHPSMSPMGGRGNNNSFAARGGNSAFNHHSALPSRRPVGQQQNNQNPRMTSSSLPKRKTPVDGFEQKEPANKKNAANGKSVASETKPAASTTNTQKVVDRTKPVPVNTGKDSSSTHSERNFKSGLPTPANTNATTTTKPKLNTTPAALASTSSTSSSKSTNKPISRQIQKTASTKAVPKPVVKTSSAVNSSTQATSQTKSTVNANNGKTAAGSNRLTIANVDESVTKRDLQTLANSIPGGFSSITLDRTGHSAEIAFKTVEGAKLFRRIHNRSQLGGSNIVTHPSRQE
ncbi:16095_t:CDS:2 [Acaulospora morrowiae]|uniref:16095_t:CDS:1 n=1 Tax=Acaulospora morrowiae TaxID=94023 RepID=A0A9N8Z3L5_9GLOM|nr:16095_t:CDS:2 [Acaulospora morrowiae]